MPSDPSRRAVITGCGLIAPAPFAALMRGETAPPPETAPEITGFETPEGAPAFGFEVPEFKLEEHLPNLKTYVDRTSALALAATRLALADAGLLDRATRPAGAEIGCAYGTTLGCLEAMGIFWKKVKSTNPKFAPPLPFTHGYANSPSSLMCIEFGLKGSAATFSGEQLAGLEALLFAVDQIAAGCAGMVAVAASESLTRAAHAHLHAAGRLSATGRLKAWGAENDGVVPGEGAACLIVESAAGAAARGRKAYARIAGVGLAAGNPAVPFPEAWLKATKAAIQGSEGGTPGPALFVSATPVESGAKPADVTEKALLEMRHPLASTHAAAVAPKLYTGEVLSVSPLFGVVYGAHVLAKGLDSGKVPRVLGGAYRGPPDAAFTEVWVSAADPSGTAGMAILSGA